MSKKTRIITVLSLFIALVIFLCAIGVFFKKDAIMTAGLDEIVAEKVLVPGGQSVGIEMEVKGALIVGVERNMGIKPGDMITTIDGKHVNSAKDVQRLISSTGKATIVGIKRDNKRMEFSIKPIKSIQDGKYKLGFWVKERVAGIGTLTYYDPEKNIYAALGHGIYESETGKLLDNKKGRLVHTKVEHITSGSSGNPGELGGVFYDCYSPIGTIDANTPLGLFAKGETNGETIQRSSPMVVGTKEQIKEGKAYILTTISGTNVGKYSIDIKSVKTSKVIKGIEFEVTDKKLLKICGGIVQGMSGSPIIQDNRIVGAVTHVFVDNPTRGYGIFIENMLAHENN